jgi:hypothetical protein
VFKNEYSVFRELALLLSSGENNGHAMAEAVSYQPFTTEAWVCARSVHVVFVVWVDRVALGQFFLLSSLVFLCKHHSTMALHTHIIWAMNNRPVDGHSSETLSHPICV